MKNARARHRSRDKKSADPVLARSIPHLWQPVRLPRDAGMKLPLDRNSELQRCTHLINEFCRDVHSQPLLKSAPFRQEGGPDTLRYR